MCTIKFEVNEHVSYHGLKWLRTSCLTVVDMERKWKVRHDNYEHDSLALCMYSVYRF